MCVVLTADENPYLLLISSTEPTFSSCCSSFGEAFSLLVFICFSTLPIDWENVSKKLPRHPTIDDFILI